MPNGQDHVTKQDLQQAVAGLEQRLAHKQDLLQAVAQLDQSLTEKMRDMQTEMLRAFHN
jgi:hypothetical protein